MIGYPLMVNENINGTSLLDNRIKGINPLEIEDKLSHWENATKSYLSTDFTIKDLIKETGIESDLILFHLTSIKGLNYDAYITNLKISYAIKLSYLNNLIDILPDKIQIPNNQTLKYVSLENQIKNLSKNVVLIKCK